MRTGKYNRKLSYLFFKNKCLKLIFLIKHITGLTDPNTTQWLILKNKLNRNMLN